MAWDGGSKGTDVRGGEVVGRYRFGLLYNSKRGFFLSIQDAESSWEHDSKRWRAFSPRLRSCPRRLCHGPGACN